MKYWAFAVTAAVMATGCNKSGVIAEDDYLTLRYRQTQCADRWAYANNDTLQQAIVARYLDSMNLYVASVDISSEEPGEACAACVCKTGKVIIVSTLNADSIRIKYEALGFVR